VKETATVATGRDKSLRVIGAPMLFASSSKYLSLAPRLGDDIKRRSSWIIFKREHDGAPVAGNVKHSSWRRHCAMACS